MKYRRRKNFLRALILGFATAAIVVSSAEARVSNYNTSAQNARAALNQTYTPEALKALALRSEAMNQQYQSVAYGTELRSEAMNKLYQTQAIRPDDRSGIRGSEPTGVAPWMGQVNRYVFDDPEASVTSSQAGVSRPDDRAGLHGPGIVRTPELVTATGGGFAWTDASIGAGATIGIVLVLMSGIALSRRRSELAV
jgi:hypothetical protein